VALNWEDEWARRVEKYSGKTVDELFALANGDEIELLFSIEIALQLKAEKLGAEALSQEERTYLAIEALEREVNNGGYSQFFTNQSSEYAPIVVESLIRIDCPQVAAISRRAIEAIHPVEWTPSAVADAVAAYQAVENARWQGNESGILRRTSPEGEGSNGHESIFEELDKCDQLYYSAGENIGGQLIQYVKANKAAIRP
jgi:hypothetical protein